MSWPSNAPCAIALTIDNLGEAADLNRNLWPASEPIGAHYSITRVLPRFLALLRKYSIRATFFVEAWNLAVYPHAIRSIVAAGHELAWHAWQHEAWGKECADAVDERANFERSWSAMRDFIANSGEVSGEEVPMYRGFRPPGGVVHGERTLRTCRSHGLGYISPAAEDGAVVALSSNSSDGSEDDSIVVLPFRWRTVDAYYYLPTFQPLRNLKDEAPDPANPQSPSTLVQAFKSQIDDAVTKGGFLSLLFHPFLTDTDDRLQAMEEVVAHLAQCRDEGLCWLAPCREVESWVRDENGAGLLGADPKWDETVWR